jgi:hypothetical protein
VEFSTEGYPLTLKDFQSKISLIQGYSKSPASIRANECFLPLSVIKGVVTVVLVWTIESGLECSQWLLRKLKITVLMH